MRLFIGIPLESDRQELVYQKLHPISHSLEFRLVKPENYHITIQFLGETSIQASILGDALRIATDAISPFTFTTDKIVGFPGMQKATSIGLSVLPKDPFITIRTQAQKVLHNFGFTPGKSMIPHITVARMKHPVNISQVQNDFRLDSISQIVSEIVIYQSILQSAGPIYHQLVRLNLKGELNG
jgi:2'-5' RNA ligase